MDLDTKVHDNLMAGSNQLPVADEVTILLGQNKLARGTVLGQITSGGKCVIVNSAGTDDGRRTPFAILAEDIDATSGDVKTVAYKTGEFNEAALVFGGSDTADTHRAALRLRNIHLKTVVPA